MIRNGLLRTVARIPFRKRLPNQSDPHFSIEPEQWDIIGRPPPKLENDPSTGWSQKSRRVGVLAQKVGMTHDWDSWLNFVPLTIIHIPGCYVAQVKTKEKDGYTAVQVASGYTKPKNMKKPQVGHLAKFGVTLPKNKIAEFRVSEDALVPSGTEITASHFIPGQYLDITGISKGKGFQGPMKRWGFGGGPASHGNSKSHRSHGSTGNCQDPGKVWKGKKMAGRMGGERVTVKNLVLFKVDPVNNLLYVRGAVPGCISSWIQVKDAKNKEFKEIPPFPTHIKVPGEVEEEKIMFVPKPTDLVWEVEDIEQAQTHYKDVEREKIYAERAEKEVKRGIRRKDEKKKRKEKKAERFEKNSIERAAKA